MKNTDMTNAERVVDALEAFVSAKCTYERRILDDPDWATSRDVDETRGHLREVLARAFEPRGVQGRRPVYVDGERT
jgi:hypothetical protein